MIRTSLLILTILFLPLSIANSKDIQESIFVSFDVELEEEFKRFVTSYYQSESSKKWDETYRFRSSKYKHAIDFENYKKNMSKTSEGWELIAIQITAMVHEGSTITLGIEFTEKIDKSVLQDSYFKSLIENSEHMKNFDFDYSNNTISQFEETIWDKENNEYIVIVAGIRRHLSLNSEFVTH